MAASDPLAVRIFEQQIKRHQDNARHDFASIQGRVEALASNLKTLTDSDITIALGASKNLARDVADLIADLSALAVLNDVDFLTTDTEKKTDG